MSDLIERQEAIDAIRGWVKKAFDDWGTAATEIRCFNAIYPLIMALPSAQPEIPPYVAEIEAEYKKWVNVPYIRKPLAKALYEVWKKHDREDVERRTDD